MANRSDRRFQILSPRMAARGRETDQPNEARGNPSRPGSSDARQAGRIYDCNRVPNRVSNSTLDTGGVHICLAERGGFEPPAPRGLLWAEFSPSLAHYSARQKASVPERICSLEIRLCSGSLRFASGLDWQRLEAH